MRGKETSLLVLSVLVVCYWVGVGLATELAYCSAGSSLAEVPDNLELRFVQLLTRHGARVPFLGPLPGTGKEEEVEWECSVGSYRAAQTQSTLFNLLWLNGRQELKGNCGLGSLTELGYKQHVLLGKSLREKYVDRLLFLNSSLSLDQIFSRSTDSERTIMSAEGLLTGLYPPKDSKVRDTETVPVYRIDSYADNLTPTPYLCPKLGVISDQVANSEAFKEIINENADLQKYLEKLWGVELEAWGSVPNSMVAILDNLQSRICHDLPLPAGINASIVTQVLFLFFHHNNFYPLIV
eukprot:CAMPEP_0174252334 /NCGR_PEP_ID=MMETSP0439-20130205/1850_1 /TAXON_ID=0 /ORGANISM="Stereomyxa ramosa, Strain Chinc5" /LENGTH=294 /DNA_ID=CAMNT_0015332853 /DNA_START=9 /DNA_END=890 /DNA_ORIENTATION=+